MSHREQKSSAVGVTVVAIVIAVGLMCLLGVAILAGLMLFGTSYSMQPSAPVMVSATPLPPPSTAPYTPVYPSSSLPQPVYDPYATAPAGAVPALKSVSVVCDAEGDLSIDGESIDLEELVKRLDCSGEAVMVTMRIDPSIAYGKVADIEQCLREAGYPVNCQVDRDDTVTVQE